MKPLLIIPLGLLFVIAGAITGYMDYKASIPDYPRDDVPLSVQREYDSLYRSAEDQGATVQLARCKSGGTLNKYLTVYSVSTSYGYGGGTTISYYSDKGTFISSDYIYEGYDKTMTSADSNHELPIEQYSCKTISTTPIDWSPAAG